MNARTAGYWTTTAITAFCFLTGGVAYLLRAGFVVPGVAALGYPPYFLTLLGTWKVLGALAIVAPRFPRLKEWAYAGIAFDLTGAAFSHIAVGEPVVKSLAPLALLAVAATSWALRPANRVLGVVPGRA